MGSTAKKGEKTITIILIDTAKPLSSLLQNKLAVSPHYKTVP
jgi:hypothetical protein